MAYDKRGYITSETAYTNYGTAETVNKSYTYDNIGRLTNATVGEDEKTYTYDSVGNRLTMSDGTDTYMLIHITSSISSRRLQKTTAHMRLIPTIPEATRSMRLRYI